MTLKAHIGVYLLFAMALSVMRWLNDDMVRKYEWYIPFSSAAILFSVAEAFGWVFWWAFISA